jgi:hypothetical protein
MLNVPATGLSSFFFFIQWLVVWLVAGGSVVADESEIRSIVLGEEVGLDTAIEVGKYEEYC